MFKNRIKNMKEVGWAQVVPASQLYVVDLFPTH